MCTQNFWLRSIITILNYFEAFNYQNEYLKWLNQNLSQPYANYTSNFDLRMQKIINEPCGELILINEIGGWIICMHGTWLNFSNLLLSIIWMNMHDQFIHDTSLQNMAHIINTLDLRAIIIHVRQYMCIYMHVWDGVIRGRRDGALDRGFG